MIVRKMNKLCRIIFKLKTDTTTVFLTRLELESNHIFGWFGTYLIFKVWLTKEYVDLKEACKDLGITIVKL
jgi:hypothetical protein